MTQTDRKRIQFPDDKDVGSLTGFQQLMQLLAQENFTEFSHHESFQ